MNMEAEERIPFYVESKRGDDRLGTDPEGKITSDAKAAELGTGFQEGVPPEKIQEAVEGELKDGNWVTVERKDGSTDLLTKHDVPEERLSRPSWRDAFDVKPVPKEQPSKLGNSKPTAQVKTTAVPAAAAQTTNKEEENEEPEPEDDEPKTKEPEKSEPRQPNAPKEKKEVWTSRFTDIKSATATNKVKPG